MYKTPEEKRVEHLTVGAGIAAVALGTVAIPALLEHHSHGLPNDRQPKIEKHGDHHGSGGMPSDERLKQFTQEHGIKMFGMAPNVQKTIVKNHAEVGKP